MRKIIRLYDFLRMKVSYICRSVFHESPNPKKAMSKTPRHHDDVSPQVPFSPKTCPMMSNTTFLETLKQQYLEALPAENPTWATDVKVLYRVLNQHLFEEDFSAKHAIEECGLRDHNVTSHFKHYTGFCIKSYQLHHRVELV